MSAKRRHPSPDEWIAWIQDPESEDDPAVLRDHLSECSGCRALVETLRVLSTRSGWAMPSDDVTARASRLPRERRVPRPQEPLVMHWDAPDVRGEGSAVADDARIVARSCPAGEISVMSFPPSHDGRVRVEGRVWLRKPSKEEISIVLGHEDHVVSELQTPDGAPFVCDEILAPGWQIEIHFPSGESVVLGDPFADG